ncbi:MAG: sigma 54-interacting transcriptional regulator [Chitinispirillaceae bacterium]|nr:sigma 54-interacting transcriptional regulator [Chitinispirillaceae bacterium]
MHFDDNLKEVFDYLPCGVLILDDSREIVFANVRLRSLTGLPEERMIGSNMCSVGLGSDENNQLLSGKEWWDWAEDSVIHMRTTIRDAQGATIPVFINGKRRRDRSGRYYLYLCILDISHLEEWSVGTVQEEVHRESFYKLVGKSSPMQELYNLLEMAGGTGVNVLILGESGTGKELAASAIHNGSSRSGRPFVRVNCASLAETLLESELFGHVKGAFTGAYKDRIGTFEAAHEGTILLDEIGEISPAVQVRLLRVLQERVIVRVGDNREIPVDVRIIASTNKNLREMVQQGKFREDLFYRLNVFAIHLPALNERKSDVPLLCTHFIRKFREETGKGILSVSADAMRLFMNYCWPGNVREFENAIEHAFVVCRSEEILVRDLPYELRVTAVREGICGKKTADILLPHMLPERTFLQPVKTQGRLNISRERLVEVLEQHGGNRAATARFLGISTVGLWKKMKKLGVE